MGEAEESARPQAAGVRKGRLRCGGNSKRAEGPADGYRRNSSGMPDAFPTQCASDSGLAVLRLPRPPGLRRVKSFSPHRRRPLRTPAACGLALSSAPPTDTRRLAARRFPPPPFADTRRLRLGAFCFVAEILNAVREVAQVQYLYAIVVRKS